MLFFSSAQATSRRPLTAEAEVKASYGIVVDTAELLQALLRVFQFFPVSTIPPKFCTRISFICQHLCTTEAI
jgi:hypothetical protein